MNLLKKLFSRRWLGGTLLVLFVMGLFVRLGIWQLDRLAQRRAENEVLRAVLASPPLDLAEPLPAAPEALENRLATVRGQYDFANERLVLLQTWQGAVGVQLVTPLLVDGLVDTAVLINRGWIPQAAYEAGEFARYQTAAGPVTVTGYLALSQPSSREGSDDGAREVYRVDIPAIEAVLPYDLLPVMLVASPGETMDVTPPLRAAREVDLSEGPHLSYAWQWFIFCVLTGGLYLVFVRRSERERPSSPPKSHEQNSG
ncbi:MAG: SURF1 family protein [Chloroflexota bacterium]